MSKTLTIKIPRNLRGCANTPSALVIEKLLEAEPGDTVIIEGYENVYALHLLEELLKASGLRIEEKMKNPDGSYRLRALFT